MHKLSPVFVFALAAILAASLSCAKKPDDAKVSSEIQGKYSQDSGLSSKQLTVQASNGVVTLTGFVDNDAQRAAAARQAASVEGVREVINNLQV
jgi:hyperosmotically inducible protein